MVSQLLPRAPIQLNSNYMPCFGRGARTRYTSRASGGGGGSNDNGNGNGNGNGTAAAAAPAVAAADAAAAAPVAAAAATAAVVPAFSFGHGLSYTTFAYSALTHNARHRDNGGARGGGDNDGDSGDDSATVRHAITVEVMNTGATAGAEVAQLYLSFPEHSGEVKR